MKILVLSAIAMFSALNAAAQLPPIFAETPKQILETQAIAEFPVNTFLENIAVDQKGNLFVTSYEEGKIYRVVPDGAKSEFAKITGKIAGIAFDQKGNLIVTGWADGKTPSVFRVAKNGQPETLAAIDGAMFLNGITLLSNNKFLIADSYKGAIWEFDATTKKYSIWLADEKLARSNPQNSFPGVNGLKIYNGTLYATNTERQILLKVPIDANGQPGKPVVWLEKINGDDFAVDAQGNLYLTTHVYNNVVRITPDGKTTIIAENGNVVGDTSLAFGRGKKDKNAIYVVTNGGMSLPPAGGVQTAKIVRIRLGAKQ